MRGPFDDVIQAQQAPADVEEALERGAEEERGPTPGGKPLARLMSLLESAGYVDTASATVELAVSEDARGEFGECAALFTAAPGGEPPAPATGTPGRRSRRRSARGDESGVLAEEVAETYLEVGEPRTADGDRAALTGEFRVSWGFLLVDIPLVGLAAVAGFVGMRALAGTLGRPTKTP